jgi:uncharacterized alpha-E superfamily protein
MLLSRAADGLYWIARYLERAEHAARLIEVGLDLGLGRGTASRRGTADHLYASLGLPTAVVMHLPGEQLPLIDAALFDLSSRNSVAACIAAARDNARQVREEISSDMWEQVNALFLSVRQLHANIDRGARPHYVCRSVISGIHLFQGITDATMGHAEGWQYLQAGRFLERAIATAALIGSFLPGRTASVAGDIDPVDWVALLRSCSALEAYCRYYTADVRAERVAEFLLLNVDFPRSVRFAAARLESAVLALARASGRGAGGRAERLAGRLHASLDYGQVDEILEEDPAVYLDGVSRQCAQIHAALYQSYISYAIESAIPA